MYPQTIAPELQVWVTYGRLPMMRWVSMFTSPVILCPASPVRLPLLLWRYLFPCTLSGSRVHRTWDLNNLSVIPWIQSAPPKGSRGAAGKGCSGRARGRKTSGGMACRTPSLCFLACRRCTGPSNSLLCPAILQQGPQEGQWPNTEGKTKNKPFPSLCWS